MSVANKVTLEVPLGCLDPFRVTFTPVPTGDLTVEVILIFSTRAPKTDDPKPKKDIPKQNDLMRDIPEDNIPALESLPGEDSTLKEDTPDSTFTDDSSLNEHTQKQHLPKQPKEGTQKGDTPQDQGSGVSAEQPEIVYRKFAGRIGEKTWFVTFPCAKAPKRKTPDPDESVTETESEREDFDPWLWFGAWNKPSSLENEPEASCGPSGDGSAPRSGTCPSGGYMAGT